MTLSISSGRTIAALLALSVLLVGATGPALAADPSVDSEATDTATQSEITDGHTVSDFNASTDNISTLQYSVDSTDPGIKIVDPDTGEVIKSLTNASNPDYFAKEGDDGAGTNYYNVTFEEADFGAVPMGAGENKSVELRMVNNTSLDNPDTANITIHLNNTDERAVIYAGSSAEAGDAGTDTDLTAENKSRFLLDDIEQASVSHSNLAVKDNTTVYVLYADDNASDAYTAAADRTPLTMWGDYSAGDAMWSQQVAIEDSHHIVFDSEPPSEVADGATYGYTTSVDGYDAVAVELGDDYGGDTSVDVNAEANAMYNILDRVQLKSDAFGGFLASLGLGFLSGGFALGGLALFGRIGQEA